MSILETIRRAVASGDVTALADQPGADASTPEASGSEGKIMPDQDAIGAALSAATTVATADAVAKARTETRDRIKAITGAAEAKGREALASHLAYETDMTVEAATAALKAAPGPAASADPPAGNDKPDAAAYEQERLASAGLTEPGKPGTQANPTAAKAGWTKAFSRFR